MNSHKKLQDHKNKCRCCFKQLKSAQKTVEISKYIEKRFLVLTGIKLIKAENYSNVICESCNSKLSEFADFREEMIENQTSLYKFEPCEDAEESADEQMIEVPNRLPMFKVEAAEESSFQFVDMLPANSKISNCIPAHQSSSIEDNLSAFRKKSQTSFVWNYFIKLDEKYARCTKCDKMMAAKSTSSLSYHLEKIHNITKNDDQTPPQQETEDHKQRKPKTEKRKRLDSFSSMSSEESLHSDCEVKINHENAAQKNNISQ